MMNVATTLVGLFLAGLLFTFGSVPWLLVTFALSVLIEAGVLVLLGSALVVSCITTFVFIGRGTPAPFDPPRRLVIRGPYRWIRNPMYVGAGAALLGAALYYRSLPLAAYGLAVMGALHLFVVIYEEPALRRTFGREYRVYCERTGRWWPKRR